MTRPTTNSAAIPTSRDPIVLMHGDWRIEIHLRQDDNGMATLLAYAGRATTPERATAQGPFQRAEQAVGARRGIVQQLMANGYQLAPRDAPIWSLNAQRDIRAARERKQHTAVSCEFDPSDVFLDW